MKIRSFFVCVAFTWLWISIYGSEVYAAKNPQLSFDVISDIHCWAGTNDRGKSYNDYLAENKFANALEDLHTINPGAAALVIVGDLTVTGLQGDYDSMSKVLRRNSHPQNLLFAMGNHEFYSAFRNPTGKLNMTTFPNGISDSASIQRFMNNTNVRNLYYDRWVRGYHFIVLGSEQFRIARHQYSDNAVLSNKQLQWLQNKLDEGPQYQPVFVFLHQPIPFTVAGSDKKYIVDSEKLRSILRAYPQVIFFSGHSHYTFKYQPRTRYQDQFTMVNVSSVRNPITPFGEKLANSEGLCVEVYENHVEIKERDFSHHVWIEQFIVKPPVAQNSQVPLGMFLLPKQG